MVVDLMTYAIQAVDRDVLPEVLIASINEYIKTWSCGSASEIVTAKALCRLVLRLQSTTPKNLLLSICYDIVTVAGRLDEETPEARRPLHAVKYKFCTSRSVEAIVGCTLAHIKGRLDELNWTHDLATIVCRRSTAQGVLTVSYVSEQLHLLVRDMAVLSEASITGTDFHKLVEALLALLKLASALSRTVPS